MTTTDRDEVLDELLKLIKKLKKTGDHNKQLGIVSQIIGKDPSLRSSIMEYDDYINAQAARRDTFVLVVDDNRNLAKTFQTVLQRVGFNVDVADSGLKALYKVGKKKYHLVIMDINLPDMMGDEVARKMLEDDENLRIILITGYSSIKNKVDTVELGVKKTLMKPIHPEELVKHTDRALRASGDF